MIKKAFLAGRYAYASPLSPLRGCATDVCLSKEILRRGYCSVREDAKHVLDPSASCKRVLAALVWLVDGAHSGDTSAFSTRVMAARQTMTPLMGGNAVPRAQLPQVDVLGIVKDLCGDRQHD